MKCTIVGKKCNIYNEVTMKINSIPNLIRVSNIQHNISLYTMMVGTTDFCQLAMSFVTCCHFPYQGLQNEDNHYGWHAS